LELIYGKVGTIDFEKHNGIQFCPTFSLFRDKQYNFANKGITKYI